MDAGQRAEHEKTHRLIREYKCQHCDKKFPRSTNARCHEKHCKTHILAFPRSEEDDENEDDSDEFIEQSSSFRGASKLFRLDFATGIKNLFPRLQQAIILAEKQLEKLQRDGHSVKYFVSLHSNFYKVTDPDIVTNPPIVFHSGGCTLLPTSIVQLQLEIIYTNLLNKVSFPRLRILSKYSKYYL